MPPATAAFEAATANLFERIARLERWHRGRVRANVHSILGAEPSVPLDVYLARAKGRAEEPAKLVAELARAVATGDAS